MNAGISTGTDTSHNLLDMEVFEEVYDSRHDADKIQEALSQPNKIITRSKTSSTPVLEYFTFTKSVYERPSYFQTILKTPDNTKTRDSQQIGNLVLNMLLPIPMVGSMAMICRKNMKQTRQLTDYPAPINAIEEIMAGSSVEGLGLPQIFHLHHRNENVEAPDEDTLYVFQNFIVHPTRKDAFASLEPTTSSPPVYVKLRHNHSFGSTVNPQNCTGMLEFTSFVTNDGYIDRKKLVRMLRSSLRDAVHNVKRELTTFRCKDGHVPSITFSEHGPAISVDIKEGLTNISYSKDYVMSLPCPKWPKAAQKWSTRQRIWPSKGIVKRIIQDGCHIVPKGYQKRNADSTEFILSFSLCDRTLCQSLSLNQKRCYMLFKFIFKNRLNKVKRGLASYFCKQTFLWLCERKPDEEWREDNPVECLIVYLSIYLSAGTADSS